MRQIKKYKIYQKINLVSKFPVRILRFKRPKWLKLKIRFFKRTRPRLKLGGKLVDITYNRTHFGSWGKLGTIYKTKLRNYSFLSGMFDTSLNLKTLKRQASALTLRKDLFSKIYFENYYKPHVLTWLASLASSTFESKQQISSKMLKINDKKASPATFLKRGDIVSILDPKINVEQISKRFNKTSTILSHTEIDYYSQNIAIIKDLSALSKEDFLILTTDYINIKTLK